MKCFHFGFTSGGSYHYYYDYMTLSLAVLSLALILQFIRAISATCRRGINQMADNLPSLWSRIHIYYELHQKFIQFALVFIFYFF